MSACGGPEETHSFTLYGRANSAEDAVRRGQRQVEQVKLKIGIQMDDKTFQSSLLETQVCMLSKDLCFGSVWTSSQVMLTKDSAKWNFEMLQELIEGPLLNPKRLEEAIKVARFMRRLLFYFVHFISCKQHTHIRMTGCAISVRIKYIFTWGVLCGVGVSCCRLSWRRFGWRQTGFRL